MLETLYRRQKKKNIYFSFFDTVGDRLTSKLFHSLGPFTAFKVNVFFVKKKKNKYLMPFHFLVFFFTTFFLGMGVAQIVRGLIFFKLEK